MSPATTKPATTTPRLNRTALAADLIRDEDEILHAYQDSEGYWTIGVGQLIDKRKGGKISQAASRFMLQESITEKIADLDKYLPWWRELSEVRQRVLVNMCFNMGIGNTKKGLLSFRNTLAAIKDGRYDDAARGMLASKWARQVGDRAKRLAYMMKHNTEIGMPK